MKKLTNTFKDVISLSSKKYIFTKSEWDCDINARENKVNNDDLFSPFLIPSCIYLN